MKDHQGDIRKYIYSNEAWYYQHFHHFPRPKPDIPVQEVMFGLYAPGGGTSGEMGMRWHRVGSKLIPRLEAYQGGWHALAQFKDVLDALAEIDDTLISPSEFCALLDHCGFVDGTPRKYEDSYPNG